MNSHLSNTLYFRKFQIGFYSYCIMIFCRSNNGGFILNIVWLKHSGLLFSIQSGLMNRPNFSGPIAFLTWAFSKLPSLWPGLALNPHRLPPCQSTFQTHSEWLRYPRTVFESCYPANRIEIKLIYSEKATTFCEIFPLILTVCTAVKSKGKISQILWPSQNIWTLT